MPRYRVTLTEEERETLKTQVQKGGKGYRIKHAQILLKLVNGPKIQNGRMTRSRMPMEQAIVR